MARDRQYPGVGLTVILAFGLGVASLFTACEESETSSPTPVVQLDPKVVAQGKDVFRFATFDDERYWTDTLRMHEVVAGGVSPKTALAVGLKVDMDTLPPAVAAAIA